MNTENKSEVEIVVEKVENKVRNIDKLRTFLKEKAAYIRGVRNSARLLKEAGHGKRASEMHSSLFSDSRWYRHHHIAYCELMGRLRAQIEKPKEYHKANEQEIERIKTEYAWTNEEIAKYNERKAKREEVVHSR